MQSYKGIESTQHEAMGEVGRLKEVFMARDIHKPMLDHDNFVTGLSSMSARETQLERPLQGYGSILPRHTPEHGKMNLDTTYKVNYQYPFEWTHIEPQPVSIAVVVCTQYMFYTYLYLEISQE